MTNFIVFLTDFYIHEIINLNEGCSVIELHFSLVFFQVIIRKV